MRIGNTELYDKAGVLLSLLCAVHCIGVSLLALVFPLLGTPSGNSHFHEFLALILLCIAVLALGRGYLRHRRLLVIVLGSAGMSILFLGVFIGHETGSVLFESLVTVPGSILLVSAHLYNLKHLSCKCCEKATDSEQNEGSEIELRSATSGVS